MTRQQMDGYASIVVSALSRCTGKGLEHLRHIHGHTILLLQWHTKHICRIDRNGIGPCEVLMADIQRIQYDTELYHGATVQPTLEWEELKV